MIRLGGDPSGVNVIRMPGERHRVDTLKFGSGSLMMQGFFHANSLGPLVLLRGMIDKYINMLANHIIP